MKPVDQTTFGLPGGNCFSACVASLLEIPIDEVPYFMGDTGEVLAGDDPEKWFERFEQWLSPRGLYPILLDIHGISWRPAGLHILSGCSPRGRGRADDLHSVVAQGSEILHDPHPSRDSVLTIRDVTVLVPLNPAILP